MAWAVEFTDEFEHWWDSLSVSEQAKVDARIRLLMDHGPNLGYPSFQHSDQDFPLSGNERASDPIRR